MPRSGPWWRLWLAVTGPALMVSVGYMDPGNWATDLAGGSRYRYSLIWVLLLSNLMAVLLQSLAARLGIVRRLDLAQANRERYPPLVNFSLYLLAEVAITACDLAEVIGSAVALQLLFGLPLKYGVLVTALDVLLLLMLTRFGVRKLEAVVISLVGMIGIGFMVEILLAKPAWGALAAGFVPTLPDRDALYIAIGILGATVMPHNLYLHSSLVQTRQIERDSSSVRRAIRWNVFDSAVALNLAFLVNAAILVMAAAVFYEAGLTSVTRLEEAHHLLASLVGAGAAPVLFALALLASGQSSTITGTLAGQIVMEGYLNLRIRPWLRRVLTRAIAIVPALFCVQWYGDQATGELLVLSQVVLSLQLPFAIVPLIHFVSERRSMGEFAIGAWLKLLAWSSAALIIVLNGWLIAQTLSDRVLDLARPGTAIAVGIVVGSIVLLLLYVTVQPLFFDRARRVAPIHPAISLGESVPSATEPYKRVAIALDLGSNHAVLLRHATRFLGASRPHLILLHVVESPASRAFGRVADDAETEFDRRLLEGYAEALRAQGFSVETQLGSGDQVRELARLVNRSGAELVILGGHGHRGLKDLLYGTTTERLRHRVSAAVLVAPVKD